MKLSKLIATLQKTDNNKDWGVDLEKLGSEFGLYLYGEYYDGDILVSYFHQDASWICTDTKVGIKMYFLDNELICVSTQRGRKSSECFKWISSEAKNKLFKWLVKNFVKNSNEDDNIADMDEDVSDWISTKNETEKLRKKFL